MKPIKRSKGLPAEISLADLCWLLGLTRTRIPQLVDEGVIERTGYGRYKIESVPRVIAAMRKSGAGPKNYNDVRTAIANEKLRALQRTREREEGLVLPKDAYRIAIGSQNRSIRNKMLALGTRIAPQVFAAKSVPAVQQIIDSYIREALEAIAEPSHDEGMRALEDEARRIGVDILRLKGLPG
jgi:hypothetical protein